MTFQEVQIVSFGVGVLAYLCLTVFCIVTWIRRITGKAAFLAAVATLAFILTLGATGESALSTATQLTALYLWIVLLLRAVGFGMASYRLPEMRPVTVLFIVALALLVAGSVYAFTLPQAVFTQPHGARVPLLAAELLMSVCGLVAVEQLARNARDDYGWRVRYLNIGLGILFTYCLLHSAFGLLYSLHLPVLTAMLPTVLGLSVPFVAIASLRNRANRLRVNVSRQFVFRTGVFIATGTSLLLIGLAGYYVRLFGGDVGTALVVLLATVFAALALVVTGSSSFRGKLRRFISENLYESRYDHRHEWARVSRQLTEPSADFSRTQQAIRAFLGLLGAPGGAIWRLSEGGALVPMSQLHTQWDTPFSRTTTDYLREFFALREWIIDLARPPDEVEDEAVAAVVAAYPDLRFLIPLCVEQELFGLVGIAEPDLDVELTWEDYDILKLVSRQAAGFLALEYKGTVLSDAQQLHTYNRLSAFVVHDVKTISAQLSLLLENAQRHKTNPAFIEDMLDTVGNSVERMQKLLKQFQDRPAESDDRLELGQLAAETLRQFDQRQPQPVLCRQDERAEVVANGEKLAAVIGHTVENAIEATPESGSVSVSLSTNRAWAELAIVDDGAGMEAEFIEHGLFRPFASTKGLTGMGIGAYQTREYIRSIGGDVQVTSTPGAGTRFTLRIPLAVSP